MQLVYLHIIIYMYIPSKHYMSHSIPSYLKINFMDTSQCLLLGMSN